MAGRSERFDLNQNRVVVAIETHLDDLLKIPRRFTLVPKLLTASAPEMRLPLLERHSKRFLIHVCDRQHLARAGILEDGRNQSIGSELCFSENIVHRTITPRSRRYAFAWPIVTSRKWKIEAASTALALPS